MPPRAKGKKAAVGSPLLPWRGCCMKDAGVTTRVLVSWATPGTLLVLLSVGICKKGASYFCPSCKMVSFWLL